MLYEIDLLEMHNWGLPRNLVIWNAGAKYNSTINYNHSDFLLLEDFHTIFHVESIVFTLRSSNILCSCPK